MTPPPPSPPPPPSCLPSMRTSVTTSSRVVAIGIGSDKYMNGSNVTDTRSHTLHSTVDLRARAA